LVDLFELDNQEFLPYEVYVAGCNFCDLPSAVAIDQFDTFMKTGTNVIYLS